MGAFRHIINIALIIVIAGIVAWGVFYMDDGEGRYSKTTGLNLMYDLETLVTAAEGDIDGDVAASDDYTALTAALAPLINLEYDGVDGDAATNVRLSLGAFPDAGIAIDRLVLTGANVEGIAAAVNGEWTTLPVADRIDATGVELYGLGGLVEGVMGGMMASMEAVDVPVEIEVEVDDGNAEITDSAVAVETPGADIEIELSPEEMAALESDMTVTEAAGMMDVQRYEASMGRLVIDGLVLHAPKRRDLEGGEVWEIVGLVADIYQVMSADRMVAWDTSAVFAMDMGVAGSMAMEMSYDRTAYGGLDRGDVDVAVVEGTRMLMSQSTPTFEGATPIKMATEQTIGLFGVQGLRLSGLLDALSAGGLPAMDQTDILSLGEWRMMDSTYAVNDRVLYTEDESIVDLSRFHWLLPTDITVSGEGLTYRAEGIAGYLEDTIAMTAPGDEEAAEVNQRIRQVTTLLEENGLGEIVLDYSMDYGWSPETGRMELRSDTDGVEFADFDFGLDLTVPSYEQMRAMPRTEAGYLDVESVSPILMQASAFNSMEFSIADHGMLDKVFGMVVGVATTMQADVPQAAIFANKTPQQARGSVGAMMQFGGAAAAGEFPPAAEWIAAMATFIQEGGTLRIAVEPETPIDAAAAAELEMMETPQEIVDRVGISVTHTKSDVPVDNDLN